MAKKVSNTNTQSAAQVEVNKATTVSAPETLNQHTVDAFVCILVKGDKSIVQEFKDALEARKITAMATIRTNWDNNILDKDGLPKGSAPNDLYNTVAEVERGFLQIHSDRDRVGIAASTVRTIIAKVCSEITRLKSELAGKSGKVSTNNSQADNSYLD